MNTESEPSGVAGNPSHESLEEEIQSGSSTSFVPVVTCSDTALVPVTRFSKRISEQELEKAICNRIPKNTSKSTNWGVSIFAEWLKERDLNATCIPNMSNAELNEKIALFVHKVVKKDGTTPYPPNSLYQIVVSIQRFLRENGRPGVAFSKILNHVLIN